MRIAVEHKTTKANARAKIEQKIASMMAQFGSHADDVDHHWMGDTLMFKGKARGFTLQGTAEVTDAALIIELKLPLLARAFEGTIRQTVQAEADSMFRTA